MDAPHELVLNVYRLAQEAPIDAFQEKALDLVRGALPFDSCRWGMALTFADDRLSLQRAHLYNELDGVIEAYAGVIDQDVIGITAARRSGTTINVNAGSLCAGKPDLAAFLDYMRRYRHENMLVTGRVAASGSTKSVSYYRRDADDCFDERERQLAELIFPHLMEALSINLKLGLASLARSGGADRWPLAMCDCSGLLLHAEPEFLALLALEWPQAAPGRVPAALAQALFAQGRAGCLGNEVYVAVSQRHGDVAYLKARRRTAVDLLSPRELQVARLVAQGMNFKQVAIALALSPTTVRNHIQRIHERMGIHSNTELAALLAATLP